MKWKKKNNVAILTLTLLFGSYTPVFAQDSTKKELILNVAYHMDNNKIIYLTVNAKTKIDGKFQQVANSVSDLYLDSVGDNNFIAKVTTDAKGIAKAIIPAALKTAWEASSNHTFIGVAKANKDFNETKTETPVTKTKITIDTNSTDGVRNIIVTVLAHKNGEWVPAKDVEMKVGINRLGGILSAGDEETYTTDSTGMVTVELKKDSLPGDEKGNLILAAKVEENDQYGNLLVEKTTPWGVALVTEKNFFDQRTLWSTRFRTPLWLLFMAYSIVIGVWGVLVYLIIQIFKIKKLGSKDSLQPFKDPGQYQVLHE
jgi:hypothetical protein